MGVDLQTYRCRIGAVGRGVKFGSVPSLVIPSPSLLLLLAVINMLLLISGIESNPGPFGIMSIQVLTSFKDLVPFLVWMLCMPVCVIANTNVTNEVPTRNPDIIPDDNTIGGSSNSLTVDKIVGIIVGVVGCVIAVLGFLLTWWCILPKIKKVKVGGSEYSGRVTVNPNQSTEIRVSFEDTRCSPDIDWRVLKWGEDRYSKLDMNSKADIETQADIESQTTASTQPKKTKYEMGKDSSTAWLHINNFKLTDAGDYKCVVTSKCAPCCKLPCLQTSKMVELRVENIRAHFVELYDKDKYSKIQSLLGDAFQIDVSKKDKLMEIDFSAKELVIPVSQDVLKPEFREANYVDVNLESIDEILETKLNDDSSRLVLLSANPGCGKSVYMNYLVTAFVKRNLSKDDSVLKDYSALFYLPVRNIPNISAKLPKMLSKDMGYLPNESLLDKLIDSKAKILFLVDGIDEVAIPKKSDLYKLIKGELHPSAKVLISTRPEVIPDLPYNYKVNVKGTTEQGVNKYLGDSFDNVEVKKQVEDLVKRCKEQMIDFKLLCIPLYLTIVRFVLIDHYRKNLKKNFESFEVPNTATKLYRVLIHIFLKVWLGRIGREDKAKALNLTRSPLDKSSTLPDDIKRVLKAIGKMSFDGLLKNIYNFKEGHLKFYGIEEQQAHDSGLFHFSENKEGQVLSFHHKELQEFMGGMHFGSIKLEDKFFEAFKNNRKNCPKMPIIEYCGEYWDGIENMMLFTFGLYPDFAKDLLDTLKEHVGVAIILRKINVHYESRLYYESDNKQVNEAMRRLLVQSPLVERWDIEYESPVSTVYSLCKGLTDDQSQTLLRKWYGLGINKGEIGQGTQGGEGRGIQKVVGDSGIPSGMGGADHDRQSDDVLDISGLNDVYYFMLHHCTFNNVKSVTSWRSDISDVNKISRVFPLVQEIRLYWSGDTELDEFLDTKIQNNQTDVHKPTSTITQVRISSVGFVLDPRLPRSSVVSLIQQTELQSLTLEGVDIFSDISDLKGQIAWSELHTLKVLMVSLTDENFSKFEHGLAVILQCTLQLQSLTWGYLYNKTTHNKHWDLLVEVTDKLPDLNTFRLGEYGNNYDSPPDPSHIQPLWTTLKRCSKLTTLGLGVRDVEGREAEWVRNIIIYGQHLNKVQIMYRGDEPDTVIQEVQRQITQCDPQSKITVEGWDVW